MFRSESECKGTTFSRNTKQNKNFFSTKTIFFRTKGTKDAFIGNFEEFFECKENNITNRGTDGSNKKKGQCAQYRRTKTAVLAKKNRNTGEQVLKYQRTSTGILASKYCDGAEKYILIDFRLHIYNIKVIKVCLPNRFCITISCKLAIFVTKI